MPVYIQILSFLFCVAVSIGVTIFITNNKSKTVKGFLDVYVLITFLLFINDIVNNILWQIFK